MRYAGLHTFRIEVIAKVKEVTKIQEYLVSIRRLTFSCRVFRVNRGCLGSDKSRAADFK